MKKLVFAFFIFIVCMVSTSMSFSFVYAESRGVESFVQEIYDYASRAATADSLEQARYFAGQAVVAANKAKLQSYQEGRNIPAVFINDLYLYTKKAELAKNLESLRDYSRHVMTVAESLEYSLKEGNLRK